MDAQLAPPAAAALVLTRRPHPEGVPVEDNVAGVVKSRELVSRHAAQPFLVLLGDLGRLRNAALVGRRAAGSVETREREGDEADEHDAHQDLDQGGAILATKALNRARRCLIRTQHEEISLRSRVGNLASVLER